MKQEPHVTVIDKPCGTGKTNAMIAGFKHGQRYLVVTPLLSEVERIIKQSEVPFVTPSDEHHRGKKGSIYDQVEAGFNIVTTHSLFTDLAEMCANGWFDEYEIIIDEVLDCVSEAVFKESDGKKKMSVDSFYRVFVEEGEWASVGGDGKVSPTTKWKAEHATATPALASGSDIYSMAKAGCLYIVDHSFFLWSLPPQLLKAGRSVTVLTYLGEGSLLLPYLRKAEIAYRHVVDSAADLAFRIKAKELIEVLTIGSLEDFGWSFTKQTSSAGALEGSKKITKRERDEKITEALKRLRTKTLRNVPSAEIIVTCAKSNWYLDGRSDGNNVKAGPYAKRSTLFGSDVWLPTVTRGTNKYAHRSHAIYLHDMYPNPYVLRWLGLPKGMEDSFAITELVQWLYRTRVRRRQPIKVYIPSHRMRRLLRSWLNAEDLFGVDGLAAKEAA